MTIASGARERTAYIAEVTYGSTPSNPAFSILRKNSISVGLEKASLLSEEIRSDRQITDMRHGVKSVSGDVAFELSPDSFDDFIQAALMGTWTANVLKAGTTRRSFTIERFFDDITQYYRATGCEINTMSLDIAPNAIVTGSFGIVGKDISTAQTAISGSSYGSTPDKRVFNSLSGTLLLDSVEVAVVSQLTLNLENGIENLAVVGQDTQTRGAAGRSNLSGEVTVYFEDLTFLNLFHNETEAAIELTLSSGAESYQITLPRCLFNGGKPNTEGEREISLTMPFQALYSTAEASQIVITRI